jgi:hypothetical protein
MTDFISAIRMLEQFAYELMLWMYFYPLTILRVLTNPGWALSFIEAETKKSEEEAFQTAMRPVLLLVISLCIGLLLVPLLPEEAAIMAKTSRLGKIITESTLALIIYRTIAFTMFPIVGAILYDLTTPGAVSRDSLRKPFYQQCYILAPFALIISPCLVLLGRGNSWAIIGSVAIHIWMLSAQYVFFRRYAQFKTLIAVGAAFTVPLCGWGLMFASIFLMR